MHLCINIYIYINAEPANMIESMLCEVSIQNGTYILFIMQQGGHKAKLQYSTHAAVRVCLARYALTWHVSELASKACARPAILAFRQQMQSM